MKDFRIEVKVRNNRILRAVEACGYRSLAEFAKFSRVGYAQIVSYVSLKVSPVGASGIWRESAIHLSEDLGVLPEELFPDTIIDIKLQSNRREVDADLVEVLQLQRDVRQAIATLKPREEKIMRLRYGFDGEERTLKEIGMELGVGRQRARQLLERAERKMLAPVRSLKLRGHIQEDGIAKQIDEKAALEFRKEDKP